MNSNIVLSSIIENNNNFQYKKRGYRSAMKNNDTLLFTK